MGFRGSRVQIPPLRRRFNDFSPLHPPLLTELLTEKVKQCLLALGCISSSVATASTTSSSGSPGIAVGVRQARSGKTKRFKPCGSFRIVPNFKKIEFEVVNKAAVPQPSNGSTQPAKDQLREILLQCIKDASYVIQNAKGQISDEIQKLATTLFIARTKFGC